MVQLTAATVGAPYLEVASVSKSFGSIRALDRVDFEVRSGEVMALVGENGAGKSTLVKILAGMFPPDDGQIRLGGEAIDLGTATRSEHARIAVVQQELSLVPTLSIADNLFLGDRRHGWRAGPGAVGQGGDAVPQTKSGWVTSTRGLQWSGSRLPSSN